MPWPSITYQLQRPGLSIASGYRKPGVICHLKKVQAGDTCRSLELAYPVEDRASLDGQVARISLR